jgi:hypothetical protein
MRRLQPSGFIGLRIPASSAHQGLALLDSDTTTSGSNTLSPPQDPGPIPYFQKKMRKFEEIRRNLLRGEETQLQIRSTLRDKSWSIGRDLLDLNPIDWCISWEMNSLSDET